MSRYFRIWSMIAITLSVVGGTAQFARANEHVLVIIDVTGSMSAASAGGLSRINIAKQRVATRLDTVSSVPAEYALWTFEGAGFRRIISFSDHRTAADVKAAAQAVVLGGNTPLARTMCAAVDELVNYLPNELHTKRIYIVSDGIENATPSTDQCGGPESSTLYPNLQVNSWRWKVRNKACTGNANTPGVCAAGSIPPGLTLIVDVDHLFNDFISLHADDPVSVLEPADRWRTQSALALTPDEAFFGGVAAETGGRYSAITPSTPMSQATPLPGDANADGCVNINDRALVLQQFGGPGSADFNRDGIVNTFDLQTVLQNFGRGCSVR